MQEAYGTPTLSVGLPLPTSPSLFSLPSFLSLSFKLDSFMSVMRMSRAASVCTAHWGVGLRFQGRWAPWPVGYTALAK